jgi:hypothetical protein
LLAGAAAGGGAAPNPVAGAPEIWLDASDASTVDLGIDDYATEWRDKSGNDRHFGQYALRATAQWGIRTQNGLEVADFTDSPGATSMAQNAADGTAIDLNTNKQATLQMVFACDESIAGTGIFYWGNDTLAINYFMIERRAGGIAVSAGVGNTTFNLANFFTEVGDSGYTNTTFMLITVLISTSALTIRFDGADESYSTEAGTMAIGNWLSAGPGTFRPRLGVGGANSLDGAIAELLFYNTVLSSTDYEANEDYLMTKWGL